MKYLNKFKIFEKLHLSIDVYRIIDSLVGEHDPVAEKLMFIVDKGDTYNTEEDVNFIHLSDEINKFCFTPKTKRTRDISAVSTNFSTNLMPTKIGRLVKKIFDKASERVTSVINTECVIKKVVFDETSKYLVELDESWIPLSMKFSSHINTFDGRHFNLKIKDKVIKGQVTETRLNYRTAERRFLVLYFNTEKEIPYEFIDKSFSCELELKCNFYKNDSEIEAFVNKIIAFLKINKASSTTKVEEVSGEEIRWWYSDRNYASIKGELGNSCMAHEECQPYLDLYCLNPDTISLLIVVNSDNKLIARALKWKLNDGSYFVDRVYAILQSDKLIITNFAKAKGYYYKDRGEIFFDGEIVSKHLNAKLNQYELDYYPYLDTLYYLNLSNGVISDSTNSPYDIRLRSTDGSWTNV